MNKELINKEVLAMYDMRGIQNYIFKTNAAKEVIGASVIVDGIIEKGLKEYVHNLPISEQKNYKLDWKEESKNSADAFVKDGSQVLMQVMFVGGGNAYVLYRTGELCSKVNRFLGKYVLEGTYSLNLAVAVVEKTNSYKKDYSAINTKMRAIKASMPLSQPVGAFPFMEADTITGFPETKGECCTESWLKRDAYEKSGSKDKNGEKIFDNMVPHKGDNSTLAIVHMDGNSLGKRIMHIMQDKENYLDAIKTMRKLSSGIDDTFKEAFEDMCNYLEKFQDGENKKYRKIVLAGDDITFVCNPTLALPAVKYFLEVLNTKDTSFIQTKEDKDPIFTACAGIAYFNSHFPFSDAYPIAEACCENAKERAKSSECSVNNNVGNFVDFQMCTNINASNLDTYREKHYKINDNLFIQRPYYIEVNKDKGLNSQNKKYNYKKLQKKLNLLNELPRSLAKEIRNCIPQGNNGIEKEISFLESRSYTKYKDLKDNKGIWYDACELMDLQLEGKSHYGN